MPRGKRDREEGPHQCTFRGGRNGTHAGKPAYIRPCVGEVNGRACPRKYIYQDGREFVA